MSASTVRDDTTRRAAIGPVIPTSSLAGGSVNVTPSSVVLQVMLLPALGVLPREGLNNSKRRQRTGRSSRDGP